MLILRRKVGNWVKITHAASGDVLWVNIHQCRIKGSYIETSLGFDDAPRNFDIQRLPRDEEPAQ